MTKENQPTKTTAKHTRILQKNPPLQQIQRLHFFDAIIDNEGGIPLSAEGNSENLSSLASGNQQQNGSESNCDQLTNTAPSPIIGIGDTKTAKGHPMRLSAFRQYRPQPKSLALLLNPDDLDALIDYSLENAITEGDDVLFSGSGKPEILKIEDVLFKEDRIDQYFPEDDSKWYLKGDGRAVDLGISSVGMRDIENDLLLRQLLMQNYTE